MHAALVQVRLTLTLTLTCTSAACISCPRSRSVTIGALASPDSLCSAAVGSNTCMPRTAWSRGASDMVAPGREKANAQGTTPASCWRSVCFMRPSENHRTLRLGLTGFPQQGRTYNTGASRQCFLSEARSQTEQ